MVSRLEGKEQYVESFDDWIEEIGISVLAKHLGVHRATIMHWKARRGYPRVEQMRRIKKLTHGRIGYDQMIDQAPCIDTKSKRTRGR